jgi:PAS domain-containing protein
VLPPELAGTGARLRPLLEAVSAVYGVADRALRTYEVGVTPPELRVRLEGLRRSEWSYRTLFELHPMPTLVYDPGTWRVLALNGAAAALFGYRLEEFPALDTLRAAREEGGGGRPAVRHVTRDGQPVDLLTGPALPFEGRSARLAVVLGGGTPS